MAIVSAVICGGLAVWTICDEYKNAKLNLTSLQAEAEYWQLRKQSVSEKTVKKWDKLDYKILAEDFLAQLAVEKAERNSFLNLSKGGFVGLCIFAGLGCGGIGYFGIWLVWLIFLAVYKFIRRLVLAFSDDKPKSEGEIVCLKGETMNKK